MKRNWKVFIFLMFWSLSLSGQIIDPVRWQWTAENVTATEAELRFTAIISSGWSMYAIDIPEATLRPIPTSFTFEANPAFELGDMEQVIKPEVKPDPHFNNLQIGKFHNIAIFRQKIKILKPENFIVKGEVEYMCCNDETCLAPKVVDFEIRINPPPAPTPPKVEDTPQRQTLETPVGTESSIPVIEKLDGNPLSQVDTDIEPEETLPAENEVSPLPYHSNGLPASSGNMSLWAFFLVAILAGVGSVLTPCVYPMIPMTVSFFMREATTRATSIVKAMIFGLSIMLIYTSVGVIVALTKRADLINMLVSHWVTNLIFTGIFIAFALSFFGLFEITLGGSFANKIDRKADKDGYLSVFFMALALVVISFSCTGPFVGSILVVSTQGLAIKPILGMLGFGLAFATPFTILALFPSMMNKLPKSGGWMNSVKIVFAFVMLAFSFYFLSITDKGLGLNIITRDVFLCIWIVIFALAGFYVLGKIRFPHDSEIHYINVTRLFFASASFVFALYLFTGLLGAPLSVVAGLLPADKASARMGVSSQITLSQPPDHLCGIPRFSDNARLSWAQGLQGYFDYDEAIACAKEKNKPVLLIFKGHACAKCREMEALVWPDHEILHLMNDHFILLGLYTDDTTQLPENEWITSINDGRVKRTMGQKNADFQITRFQVNTFPFHVILNANGETIGQPMGFTSSVEVFRNWLMAGLSGY